MNAALYRHSRLHSLANAWLVNNIKTHEWLIDFDLKVWRGEEYFILRPDIAGQNKATAEIDFCIEISDSTLTHDLGPKRELFAAAGIERYSVINCQDYTLNLWRLEGKTFTVQNDPGELKGLAAEIAAIRKG